MLASSGMTGSKQYRESKYTLLKTRADKPRNWISPPPMIERQVDAIDRISQWCERVGWRHVLAPLREYCDGVSSTQIAAEKFGDCPMRKWHFHDRKMNVV
jgi:hypothetical protein